MRAWLIPTALLGLAACVGPIETRRAVPGDAAEVRGRIEAELARLGLAPSSSDGSTIQASAADVPDGWAICGPTLVGGGGPDESRRMATAESRRAAVRVALAPASGGGGTEVDVGTEFTGTYRNPITTYRFDRRCRSNGVLESRLLAAAGT